MPILTPPPNRPQRGIRATFAGMVDAFVAWFTGTFYNEIVALVANLNSWLAGGAYAIPYAYGPTGTAGGAHLTAFSGAAQNTSIQLHADFVDSRGRNVTGLLDDMVAGATSVVKGTIRLEALGDPTKYLTYRVTGYNTAASDKYFDVVCVNWSAANPFGAGDPVILYFTRNGDKGDKGDTANGFSNLVVLASTQTWVCPAGITKAEITVIDGGTGGIFNSGGAGNGLPGGKGGNAGVSVLSTLVGGGSYTATIGAGSAASNGPAAGGTSSFAGPGITTLTSANATIKASGGAAGLGAGTTGGPGGGAYNTPFGGVGYGSGGHGGTDNSSGSATAGSNGVVIIRY